VHSWGSITKTGSPCEIALFGHSGSHAPQLMQSLVIIVAMNSILLKMPTELAPA
jgi:hypothetical protein